MNIEAIRKVAEAMTELLTPEQLEKITRRNRTTLLDCEIVDQSDDEIRLLLRDREAICERLELLTKHAREYMPDLCDSVCRDDHHQREFMGNHGAKGGSAFSGVKSAIEGYEELLSELRGGK